MAYAALQDLVSRYGEAELIRNTTPEDQPADAIDTARVSRALEDASGLIDSYLRRRYQVPVAQATPEMVRAACVLARYDLAFGSQVAPNEQQRLARKEVVEWLADIGRGSVTLDGAIAQNDSISFAQRADRRPTFHPARGGY